MADPKRPTFLLAGGGSGGHIAPGLAIAERLAERSPRSRTIFVCSGRPVDRRMLEAADVEFYPVPAAPLSLRPRGSWRFARGFLASRRIVARLLHEHRVASVVAMGGFVAAPAVSAARGAGVSTLLVNLDVPPGKANRWLARRCDRVVTAIELPPGHRPFEAKVVGMPIRRGAIHGEAPPECRRRLGLDPDRPTLLVLGGSQGAASLNQLIAAIVQSGQTVLESWQLLHVAGAAAATGLRELYSRHGVAGRVEPFLDRMDLGWGAASLALSRAGANAVGEAAVNAVPTLFLPYPFHRDQHQRLNAAPLERAGAAVICTDRVDPERNLDEAGATLIELMQDSSRRDSMARALADHAGEDPADRLAEMLLKNDAGIRSVE